MPVFWWQRSYFAVTASVPNYATRYRQKHCPSSICQHFLGFGLQHSCCRLGDWSRLTTQHTHHTVSRQAPLRLLRLLNKYIQAVGCCHDVGLVGFHYCSGALAEGTAIRSVQCVIVQYPENTGHLSCVLINMIPSFPPSSAHFSYLSAREAFAKYCSFCPRALTAHECAKPSASCLLHQVLTS